MYFDWQSLDPNLDYANPQPNTFVYRLVNPTRSAIDIFCGLLVENAQHAVDSHSFMYSVVELVDFAPTPYFLHALPDALQKRPDNVQGAIAIVIPQSQSPRVIWGTMRRLALRNEILHVVNSYDAAFAWFAAQQSV